jgi:hypothetical protein
MKKNKMNKSLLLLLFSIGTSWAQNPSAALLDKVSKQMASKENISLEFNYALFNAEAKINQETAFPPSPSLHDNR